MNPEAAIAATEANQIDSQQLPVEESKAIVLETKESKSQNLNKSDPN